MSWAGQVSRHNRGRQLWRPYLPCLNVAIFWSRCQSSTSWPSTSCLRALSQRFVIADKIEASQYVAVRFEEVGVVFAHYFGGFKPGDCSHSLRDSRRHCETLAIRPDCAHVLNQERASDC
jgi:hypothetical protein